MQIKISHRQNVNFESNEDYEVKELHKYGLKMIIIRVLVSTLLWSFCHCNGGDYDFSQTKEEVFGNGKMIKQRLVCSFVKGKQE